MKKNHLTLLLALSLTTTSLYADGWLLQRSKPSTKQQSKLPPASVGDDSEDFTEPSDLQPYTPPSGPDRQIVKYTKGIVLVNRPEAVSKDGMPDVAGVETVGVDVPGGIKRLRKWLEPLFIGKPLTQSSLIQLKREVILYYRKHNRPVVTVQIPEQNVTQGVVQLIVIEAKVGQIICKGNKWFSDKLILSDMHLESGDPIDSNELLNDVAWLNTNPFRKTDIIFTPGRDEEMTDIELITKDRIPLRVYAGADNTGTLITGLARYFAGFTWANAFGLDHRLTYQATSGPDFHKFFSHTLNYIAPLPWHHNLIFWGGYSEFHANLSRVHTSLGKFKDDGHSAQASVRYEIPIGPLYKSTLKNVVFGFDWKNMNNILNFVSSIATTPIINKQLNIAQFMGGFDWGHETRRHKLVFGSEVYYSPGEMMVHQSKKDFEDLRPGADAKYFYGKVSMSDLWNFWHGCEFFQEYRFQLATGALIPSEQFGLGGYNTVRGYEERIYNADNAFILNWEFHTPKFSIMKWFGNKHLGDQMYFLAFGDYAIGRNYDVQPGQVKTDWLMGIGPGVRYNITPYLTSRLDWGYKVHKTHINEGDRSRWHVSVILSY